MALDTYANLQTAIGNWLNRGDLAAAIPDFIAVAEAQMLRRFRRALSEGVMLPRAMAVQNANFAIAAEYANLPGDFLGVLSFSIDAEGVQLDYVGPQNLVYLKQKRGPAAPAGIPGLFTILGSQFQFLPAPDQSYAGNLWYWQKPAALSPQNPSNWILAAHPDVYLYGALTASAPYLMDDARVGTWGALFAAGMDEVLKSDPLPSDRSWLRADTGLTFRRRTAAFTIIDGNFD